MINRNKLLELFGVKSESTLNKSDRQLFNDIVNKSIQLGGGYSIRPDLGEIAGMSQRTGYVDRFPPIFVDGLLSDVASKLHL
jgi:hypothetical protein